MKRLLHSLAFASALSVARGVTVIYPTDAIADLWLLPYDEFREKFAGIDITGLGIGDEGWYVRYKHENLTYLFGPLPDRESAQKAMWELEAVRDAAIRQRESLSSSRVDIVKFSYSGVYGTRGDSPNGSGNGGRGDGQTAEDKDIDGKPMGGTGDLDGDGTPDNRDADLDGDGIPNDRDSDLDGDGIPNEKDPDMDGDGIPNDNDGDVDGDGIPNSLDSSPLHNDGPHGGEYSSGQMAGGPRDTNGQNADRNGQQTGSNDGSGQMQTSADRTQQSLGQQQQAGQQNQNGLQIQMPGMPGASPGQPGLPGQPGSQNQQSQSNSQQSSQNSSSSSSSSSNSSSSQSGQPSQQQSGGMNLITLLRKILGLG